MTQSMRSKYKMYQRSQISLLNWNYHQTWRWKQLKLILQTPEYMLNTQYKYDIKLTSGSRENEAQDRAGVRAASQCSAQSKRKYITSVKSADPENSGHDVTRYIVPPYIIAHFWIVTSFFPAWCIQSTYFFQLFYAVYSLPSSNDFWS